jgi:hypothetical protein
MREMLSPFNCSSNMYGHYCLQLHCEMIETFNTLDFYDQPTDRKVKSRDSSVYITTRLRVGRSGF